MIYLRVPLWLHFEYKFWCVQFYFCFPFGTGVDTQGLLITEPHSQTFFFFILRQSLAKLFRALLGC